MKYYKVIFFLALAAISCAFISSEKTNSSTAQNSESTTNFDLNAYWYSGKAEISSYELKQARYGEVHEGHSVLIFVTEPFNPEKMVKSDYGSAQDVSVLKLNNTRKFNTGIYPYSMMTSSFYPFENGQHSLKVSSSSQEWCGHTYMTIENRDQFNVTVDSYFENESSETVLDKALLEDDVWTKIRLNPTDLPQGKTTAIPSLFFLRMKHVECLPYSCETTLEQNGSESTYTMNYPQLNRLLSITFETENSHQILHWEEEYTSGFGSKGNVLKTEGKLIKTMQSDYWNKNSKSDLFLRKELGID